MGAPPMGEPPQALLGHGGDGAAHGDSDGAGNPPGALPSRHFPSLLLDTHDDRLSHRDSAPNPHPHATLYPNHSLHRQHHSRDTSSDFGRPSPSMQRVALSNSQLPPPNHLNQPQQPQQEAQQQAGAPSKPPPAQQQLQLSVSSHNSAPTPAGTAPPPPPPPAALPPQASSEHFPLPAVAAPAQNGALANGGREAERRASGSGSGTAARPPAEGLAAAGGAAAAAAAAYVASAFAQQSAQQQQQALLLQATPSARHPAERVAQQMLNMHSLMPSLTSALDEGLQPQQAPNSSGVADAAAGAAVRALPAHGKEGFGPAGGSVPSGSDTEDAGDSPRVRGLAHAG